MLLDVRLARVTFGSVSSRRRDVSSRGVETFCALPLQIRLSSGSRSAALLLFCGVRHRQNAILLSTRVLVGVSLALPSISFALRYVS